MISTTRLLCIVVLTSGCLLSIQSNTANAQSIKLVGATSQGWAGGISDRYGQIYTIHLTIEQGKIPAVLDSLWLNGYCFGLKKYNKTKFKKGEKLNITILENIILDDGSGHNKLPCHDSNKSGVIYSYYIGKKKKFIDISDQVKELDFLAYP